MNAFGDLVASPASLGRRDRIAVLNRLAGRLVAETRPDMVWLGNCLAEWLRAGGPLDAVLGVTAEQGSRATAKALIQQTEVDGLLLRLATLAGGDGKALAILRGDAPCPPPLRELVGRLHVLRCPQSPAAIRRARKRQSRLR